jgi:hypothetical protein
VKGQLQMTDEPLLDAGTTTDTPDVGDGANVDEIGDIADEIDNDDYTNNDESAPLNA